jgi:hypothetical protein
LRKSSAEDITPEKPATDWLAALRQAAPALDAEQAAAEEAPEWMREESGVAPKRWRPAAQTRKCLTGCKGRIQRGA